MFSARCIGAPLTTCCSSKHPPTYTLGVRANAANVLVDPASVGASLITADRGGDVTYHGPGQLVGYPILTVAGKRGGGMADTAAVGQAVNRPYTGHEQRGYHARRRCSARVTALAAPRGRHVGVSSTGQT